MTTQTLPDVWTRAMERAASSHLHALKINERTYAVRSTHVAPGTHHLVTLDGAGKIVNCSDCAGFRGRSRPCLHCGAVARRLTREHRSRKAA